MRQIQSMQHIRAPLLAPDKGNTMNVQNLLKPFRAAALALTCVAFAFPAAAQETRLTKIKEKGVLEVGWGVFPPYEYKDVPSGELKGILIKLAEEVAARIDTKANF